MDGSSRSRPSLSCVCTCLSGSSGGDSIHHQLVWNLREPMSSIEDVEENNVVTGTQTKSHGQRHSRSNILTEDSTPYHLRHRLLPSMLHPDSRDDLVAEVMRLKRERNAVILSH